MLVRRLRQVLNEFKKEIIPLLIILFFIFLSSRALFHPGFFRTIDDITTVRIMYMVRELQHLDWLNNFPVRWANGLGHGFGYPLYLFYAPLTYYAGAILMIFAKLSHIVATKWVYAFPLLVGPVIFYWSARQKLDRLPALVATCFYTFFPFRGNDTYIRGGVGEAWAMAFVPGIFGGIFLLEKNNRWGGLLTTLFLSLTIISHNLSAVIVMPLIIFYGLFFCPKKEFWKALLLAFGITAFFWLPAYYYLPIVKVGYSSQNTGQILNYLEPISNFFKIEYPYNIESRFSTIFTYFFIFGCLIFLFRLTKTDKKTKKQVLFWLISSFFLYFLLFYPSVLLWRLTLPLTRILQFPWRLLTILSFMIPIWLGLTLKIISNRLIRIFFIVIVVIFSFSSLAFFKPKDYSFFYEYSAEDTGICALSWGDEYLPIWVKECAGAPSNQIIRVDQGEVQMVRQMPSDIEAKIETSKLTKFTVYKYYFPGWHIFIDGKETKIDYASSKQGLLTADVPKGNHEIKIKYTKTPVMWLADTIAGLSIIFFIFNLISLLKVGKIKKRISRL